MVSQSQPILASNGQPEAERSAAFTPGPWIVRDPDSHLSHTFGVVAEGGGLIASVGNLGATSDHAPTAKRWRRETPANARLIAAAPDLLVALKECADDLEVEIRARAVGELPRRIERDLETVTKARAAIAKATGQ